MMKMHADFKIKIVKKLFLMATLIIIIMIIVTKRIYTASRLPLKMGVAGALQ